MPEEEMRTEEELRTLRDDLIARCSRGRGRYFRGVRSNLEGYNNIPDMCSQKQKNDIGKTLDDWTKVIDLLELYERQEDDPFWNQRRTLIEKFVSCLIPERIFPLFPLVVKGENVTNINIRLLYWIFQLNWRKTSDISHWCTLAHEAAHLRGVFPREPEFSPDMTMGLDVEARDQWIGNIDEDREGWFREILCDLWSCYQTGPAFLWGTFVYFQAVTPDLNCGDQFHPPPNLRFAMMARLLDYLDYSRDILPKCPSLTSILPQLGMNGMRRPELFQQDLLSNFEQYSRDLFASVRT